MLKNIIINFKRILAPVYRELHYLYFKFFNRKLDESIEVIKSKSPFLITSTGRTGTLLLSKIFNSVDSYYVVHEPIILEKHYHVKSLFNSKYSQKYLSEYRLKEIAQRIKKKNGIVRYGEVNSGLRGNIKELRHYLPNIVIVHIIRDGRDYVSSVLQRKTFTKKDKYYNYLKIPAEYISTEKWNSFNRFEKICWFWNFENSYMEEISDFTVRFEDLIESFEKFNEKLAEPLNINMDKEMWMKHVKNPVNVSKSKKKNFKQWTEWEKDFFWATCETLMKKYDYCK